MLFDAQAKEITLAAADVDELRPSRTSLMPEGQLAGLTAQEAADLLAYLVTRKAEVSSGYSMRRVEVLQRRYLPVGKRRIMW